MSKLTWWFYVCGITGCVFSGSVLWPDAMQWGIAFWVGWLACCGADLIKFAINHQQTAPDK